jgi:hypothetical protein
MDTRFVRRQGVGRSETEIVVTVEFDFESRRGTPDRSKRGAELARRKTAHGVRKSDTLRTGVGCNPRKFSKKLRLSA